MISSALNSNASAMRALGTKTAVTSNNVANVNTDEFKKSRALLEEAEKNQGVRVSIDKIETEGPITFEEGENGLTERELSNVDMAEELVSTIPTQRGYEANAKAIQTADQMMGTVIDMIA